jgi:hypothetical protein
MLNRRALLKAGGAALAGSAAWHFFFRTERAHGRSRLKQDPERLVDLHPRLSYRVIDRAFQPMNDGHRVAAQPDGMACFEARDGAWVLMRNHELDRAAALGAYRGSVPKEAYDAGAFGCVSRVVLEPKSLKRRTSNLVLTGTLRNCSGGTSPWGWLSCEESTDARHGYVFLCPVDANRLLPARRVDAYGRFNHEGVCIDPVTHIAYLTEDRYDGCLYRFVPERKDQPFYGKLQAMKRRGVDRYSVSGSLGGDRAVDVEWLDVAAENSDDDSLRHDAQNRGALVVSRGEGIFFHDGAVYVASTDGGKAGAGQILKLVSRSNGPDRLELLTESPGTGVLEAPDNIVVAPWGAVFMAEDGSGDQYLRALKSDGTLVDIARNARSSGEFAGVCLSPDASTLFVNLQRDGITLAIRGPLQEITA